MPIFPAVAIVTGAASGIGRGAARALAARGTQVIAADIDGEGLARLERDAGAAIEPRILDVTDAPQVEQMVQDVAARRGRIDALVHAAGVLAAGPAHRLAPDLAGRHVDVNVKGTIYAANAAARVMVRQGSGRIVVVASIAGLVPVPGIALYSATKHAVRAYAVALAHELAPHGVHVCAVCPAVTATPMMDQQVHAEEAALTFSSRRPLSVEEVVAAILDRGLAGTSPEVVVQVPWSTQAATARLANAFPRLALVLAPLVRRGARRRQERLRSRAADAGRHAAPPPGQEE